MANENPPRRLFFTANVGHPHTASRRMAASPGVSARVVRVFEAPAGAAPAAVQAAWKAFAAPSAREHWIAVQSHDGISAAMRTK